MNIELILIGLIVGILVGMTGVGGGSLLTPVLILMGIDPKTAIGTDFIYNSITKATGVVQHLKQKTVDVILLKHLMVGSIPSALVSNVLFYRVFSDKISENLIILVLGIALIATSIVTFYKTFLSRTNSYLKEKPIKEKRHLILTISCLIGAIVGLTSIGAGSLFALFILYAFNISAPKLVGTDLTLAFLISTLTGIMMAHHGHVDYMLATNLLSGSIPGAIIGSRLILKIKVRLIKTLIMAFVFLSGILMMVKIF